MSMHRSRSDSGPVRLGDALEHLSTLPLRHHQHDLSNQLTSRALQVLPGFALRTRTPRCSSSSIACNVIIRERLAAASVTLK
jgi:hypothetical protein